MKRIFQSFLLLYVFVMASCAKDELAKQTTDLNNRVDKLVEQELTTPKLSELIAVEWKIGNWDVNLYSGTEKVGHWDGYANTISADEKKLVYRMDTQNFSSLSQPTTSKKSGEDESGSSFGYTWQSNGVIVINGIEFVVKMDGNDLLLYYKLEDIEEVGKIFNVTVDNTYGEDLNENDLTGLGVIRLNIFQPSDEVKSSPFTTQEFVEDFLAKETILGGTYLSVSKESTSVFVLGAGNQAAVALEFDPVSRVQLNNTRAVSLFNAFLTGENFEVMDYSVVIDTIAFEGSSQSLFRVSGNTATPESVVFLYDISQNEQSWLKEPTGLKANEQYSWELAQKFHDKDEIWNTVFQTIAITNDAYTFELKGSALLGNTEVVLANEQIDLSNVTPVRAKELFEAFFNKADFNFDGVEIDIDSISHRNADPFTVIVYGKQNNTEEETGFYYNTTSGEGKWLNASASLELYAWELAQKFHDGSEIDGNVYDLISFTSEAFQYELRNQATGNVTIVTLTDQDTDISNVSPFGARRLFNAFFNQTVLYKDSYSVMIDSLHKVSTDENTFVVYGKLADTEIEVEFFYNTSDLSGDWVLDYDYDGISAYDLAQNFSARNPILGTQYTSVKLGEEPFTLVLGTEQNEDAKTVYLTDQSIVLNDLVPAHIQYLFTAFLGKYDFNFKGIEVDIQKIELDGPFWGNAWDYESILFVSALTNNDHEPVDFYIDVDTEAKEWWTTPSEIDGNDMAAYLLAQKFHYKQEIFGTTYESIQITDDPSTFRLTKMFHNDKDITLTETSVSQADIPSGAVTLFDAFFNHADYNFSGTEVDIIMIIPRDEDNMFTITGYKNNTEEAVRFVLNTYTGEGEWIVAPQNE